MRLAFVFALLAWLAGCSTTRFAAGEVQTPAKYVLTTPSTLEQPALVTAVDVVGSLPVVGWFKLARDSEVRKRLDKALTDAGLDVGVQVRSQFQAGLGALKLEVGTHDAVRRKPLPLDVFANPNELPRGRAEQTFVDTSVVYGFNTAVTGVDYRPYMILNVQVLAADTHEVKYRETFACNFIFQRGKDVVIEPPATTPTWKNVAAIEADIPGASAAFKEFAALIVAAAVKRLQSDLPLPTAGVK